jgi:hypothetical protein
MESKSDSVGNVSSASGGTQGPAIRVVVPGKPDLQIWLQGVPTPLFDAFNKLSKPSSAWKTILKDVVPGLTSLAAVLISLAALMPADGKGVVLIPNTIDQATFFLRYDYCVAERVEDDEDSRSPFESCRRRELPVGLTKDQLVAKMNTPIQKIRRSDREWVFVYKDTKVTLIGGRASNVKVEIEPTPCLLAMGCASN